MTTKTADAVTGHESLAAALAAFQAEIPSVVKGATATVKTKAGGEYRYQYADLAVINPLVLPLLAKNGLSWSAKPTLMGPEFVLQYKLMHTSGEAEEGVYPLPDPGSLTAQELGSAITYARRYALCAVTGVAPGGDDDDAGSMNAKAKASSRTRQQRQEEPEPPAVATPGWAAEILDVNTIDELRAVHAKVEEKGELGTRFAESDGRFVAEVVKLHKLTPPPAEVTVGQFIGAVRKAIESKPAPAVEQAGDAPSDTPAVLAEGWETAEIPTGSDD